MFPPYLVNRDSVVHHRLCRCNVELRVDNAVFHLARRWEGENYYLAWQG